MVRGDRGNMIAKTEPKKIITLDGISVLKAWKPGALHFYGLDERDPQAYRRALYLAHLNGDLLDWDVIGNLVVNIGLQHAGDMLIDQESIGIIRHALGDDGTTPAIGDSTLTSEHVRKVWSNRSRSLQTIEFSVFYLGSEANIYIREEGCFGGTSCTASVDTGLLFSHYLQPYDNTGGSPVDLTFDWSVEIKRSA